MDVTKPKKPRGRPRKKIVGRPRFGLEIRDKLIGLYFSESEKQQLVALAGDVPVSSFLGDFVRAQLLADSDGGCGGRAPATQ